MWSIVALVATIVVGGIMLGTAALYGTRAFMGGGLETAITQASDIAQNMKGVYGGTINGSANFTTVSNSEAIKAGAIPSSMINGDGQTITGPWRNPIVMRASSDPGVFYEDWQTIPSAVCAKFAVSQSVKNVTINGTLISASSGNFASQVAQSCNQGAGSMSEIMFGYSMNYN